MDSVRWSFFSFIRWVVSACKKWSCGTVRLRSQREVAVAWREVKKAERLESFQLVVFWFSSLTRADAQHALIHVVCYEFVPYCSCLFQLVDGETIDDNKKKNTCQLTKRIFLVVSKGEVDAPRKLAQPSSIAWSNPLFCWWRPIDDDWTNGFRSLKVRSGPSTTIESLTKSFLKEKLVERLAPMVPCIWAVVVCEIA